jgi:DNA-binding NtrC family response regulator
MKNVLISWIGHADLEAAKTANRIGTGPIAQAVATKRYEKLFLLSDHNIDVSNHFIQWLGTISSIETALYPVELSSPTVFKEIYEAAVNVIENIKLQSKDNYQFTYHISPGTPQMAAVWIILAKTSFPAELIESSKNHGVKTTSVPFDLAADFIPDVLGENDQLLERLADGVPEKTPEFDQIIHRSRIMQKVVFRARQVAKNSIPVLIEGESGTGKELFARAIHKASLRCKKPFVSINCGAIPSELVESEFFGYTKGAFTGAAADRKGHFEAAHQGTIFLDEIGELPKSMQVKLLRTVQEGEVKPVGSNQAKKINVRIIAATNRNLITEVSKGTFREDLFYRLAVAVIKLPPVRNRTGDLNLLIDHFFNKINMEIHGKINRYDKKISASARNLLLHHTWPGNIRELQNTLTRAIIWSLNDVIHPDDIQDAILTTHPTEKSILNRSLQNGIDLREIMKEVAVHYLKRGLEKENHNKTKAAHLLGLPNYQTLTNWLQKYGLE